MTNFSTSNQVQNEQQDEQSSGQNGEKIAKKKNGKAAKEEIMNKKLDDYYHKIKGRKLDDVEAAFVDFWAQKQANKTVSSDGEKIFKSMYKQVTEREKVEKIAQKAKEQKQKEAEALVKSKVAYFDFLSTSSDVEAVKILGALMIKKATRGHDHDGVFWEYGGVRLYEKDKAKFGKELVLAIEELVK